MNKIFLLLLFFCFTLGIKAQNTVDASDIEKKLADVNVEGWKSKLILSVSQSEKMIEIVTQYEMGKNMIYKSSSDMDVKNQELEDLEKSYYIKVGEILSEKQYATFNEEIAAAKSGT